MTKKLAVTLMLLSALIAYCQKGCLRCTPENECLYCDATKFYKLVDGRCVASPIDNCSQMDERGRCFMCAEGYYIDPVQFTCIALPNSFIVTNCAVHVGPKDCYYCKTGFVLKNGICETNSNIITNCLYQNAKGKCLQCAKGFMLGVSRTTCITVPSIDNCLTYSNIGCKNCNSGYLFNRNRYLNIILGFKNSDQLRSLNAIVADEIDGIPDSSVFKVCESIILTNCDRAINNETCGTCSQGYYLTYNGKCAANPLPTIPNCNKYTTATVCIDCKQGFFLENAGKCTAVTPLINCLIYNTETNYSSCKKCIDEYFLNAENICMPRTSQSKIDFCTKLADEGESCDMCLSGYTFTNDRLKCLPIVEHCDIYVRSTINTLRLECSICNQGFYFNNTYKVCSRGTVENCQFYSKNSNDCATCQPNFYLVSNTCLPHNQLPSCTKYSWSDADTCVECLPFTFLFGVTNQCVSVDVIDQCQVYASKTTCNKCKDGFYLYNPSECRAIPPEFNCVQLNAAGLCTKCLNNYVLDSGHCFEPQQYIVKNCESTNINGIVSSNNLKCNFCRPNHIPINYKESFVCQDKDFMKRKYLAPQQQFDNNCLQFVINAGTGALECVRCHDDFVIEGLTCVKSCTNSARMTVYKQYVEIYDIDGNTIPDSFRVIRTNVCNTTIPNCATAVPNLNTSFNSPTYACVECFPGFFKALTIGGTAGIYVRPGERYELTYSEYGTSPITVGPGVECIRPDANVKVIGEPNTKTYIDNCEYFQMIYPKLYACNKCMWGMTGTVMDLIKNCNIYSDSQTCIECQAGYFLKSNRECMPVLDILNCATYNPSAATTTCTLCLSSHYLSANTCVARVNSLDVLYSTATVAADTVSCNTGYILDTATVPHTCRQLPLNCITATIAASVITCTQCKRDTSYLSAGNCLDGTISNCSQYAVAANTCDTCVNGYYNVSNTSCVAHTVASDTLCDTWDQSTKNLCTTCHFNSLRLQVKSKCLAVYIQISNCSEYLDIYRCKTCEAGYYLDNLGRTCRAIPAELNCVTYSPVDINADGLFDTNDLTSTTKFLYTCDKCSEKYFRRLGQVPVVRANGTTVYIFVAACYPYLQFARDQCVETDVNGSVDFGQKYCKGCTANYFPYDFNNKYVCVERNYVKLKDMSLDSFCTIYTFDGSNALKCLRCKFGYFLKTNAANDHYNTCEPACTNPSASPNDFIIPFIHKFSVSLGVISFETGVCRNNGDNISQTLTKAAYYATGVKLSNGTYSTVISKCKSGTIPLLNYVAADYYRTFVDPNGTSFDMNSPFDGFPGIKTCLDQTVTIRGHNNVSVVIPNCEYYHQLDTSIYGCMKCKFGYRGRIKGYVNGGQTNYGSIEYCEAFTDCDTTVNSGMYTTVASAATNGLLNRYFSCFKCSAANNVVVAAVAASSGVGTPTNDFTAIYGLREYKRSTATQTESYTALVTGLSESYSNFCADSTTINTTLSLASTNLRVSGCGAYYLNVDSTGADADVGLICAACLPGYAPTFDTTLTFRVTACAAILNCDLANPGNTLNKCMTCTQDYNVYNDYVNYGACTDVSSGVLSATSCYAAYNSNNCALCKPGYELGDVNGGERKCYQLGVPRCSEVSYYDDFSSNYALSVNVIDTAMYLYNGNSSSNPIAGCTSCIGADDVLLLNKVASNNEVDPYVCVTGTDNRRTSNVMNCTRKGRDYTTNKFVCRECNGGYILTQDNECTPADAVRLPNCKVALAMASDVCVQCNSAQYVIVGGVCLDTLAGTLPTGLVANCATYSAGTKDLAMGVCTVCAATYYLNGNTCVAIPDPNCSSYSAVSGCLICKNNHALFKLSGRNVCIDLDANDDTNWDYDSNCSDIIVDDGNAATEDIQTKYLNCNTCKAHTVLSTAVADLPMRSKCTNIVLSVDPQCNAYDVQATLIGSTLYCTGCSNYTTHYLSPFTKLCTARTVIANCATYNNNSDTCSACSANYVINFAKTACSSLTADIGNRAINRGYIHTCRDMPTCNTEVFYEGLEADLTSYFSCHMCKKSDEIPFIAVRTDAAENRIESLNEYGFNAVNTDPLQKGTGGLAIQCLKPINTNFNIALSANYVFPTNCALGLIKVNYAPNANKSSLATTEMDKSTVMCAACKPGFKATRTTLADATKVRYMAAACTTIANCEFSRWFNSCTQCQAGYAFTYNLATGINYDECVSIADNTQCLAVHVNGNVKTCKSCKKGSFLNKDGNCDLINPPRCEYDRFKFNSYLPSKDLFGGIFDINEGVGCNKCVEGYAAIYVKNDAFVCTESLYLVGTTLANTTFYIQNCQNYTNDPLGVLRCAVCKASFIPTVDGRCVAVSSIPNCELAQSETVCQTCAPKFVLVNRKCETPTITNCVVYHNDILGFEQVCMQCDPEYYVLGNKCVKGEVANCKVNETNIRCNECKEGFSLILANGEKNFCFPNSPKLRCKRFNIDKFQAGILECVECMNNSFVLSTSKTDFKPTFCMPFTDQEKCEVFNNNPLILSDSSYECQRCSAKFFLNQGMCTQRNIKPSECTKYQIDADKCIECAYGYYSDKNGTVCSPYPEGIKGCISYRSKSLCEKCDLKMYLRDNSCMMVDAELPNCLYYDDRDVCGTCAAGFVNINGRCVAAYAQACATYASLTECKTCEAGFGLKRDGTLLNCVQKNITNCAVSEDMEPFACLVCTGDNYPLSGVCTSISTKIENCVEYDSSANCAKCGNRTALSLDKRSCDNSPDTVAQVDPNCVNATLLDAPICNTCKHGYYFKYGLCQACDASIMEKGCYNCDPRNPRRCLMCASGFYMSAEGDCINLDTITESEGRIEGPVAAKIIADGHALYE